MRDNTDAVWIELGVRDADINLTGTASDQAESRRIRLVEGAATGNFRGAYIHYDGASNALAIGAHNNSDNLPASDVDQIVMLRAGTTRVGIGMVPAGFIP
ncbi:MAG TPA: hypothetical protein PLQ74_01470 [Pseudomonadota bacterium]|nr:hypothetical protein [Xanthomonadales bacterium]HQW80518.1 hypothetical protein [Pseudomonadota bacterium]